MKNYGFKRMIEDLIEKMFMLFMGEDIIKAYNDLSNYYETLNKEHASCYKNVIKEYFEDEKNNIISKVSN